MKRPEGFDPAARGRATPPPTAKRAPAAKPSSEEAPAPKRRATTVRAGSTGSATAVPKPVRETRSVRAAARATDAPAGARPDRIARQELRRAARERRRYERSEVRRFTVRSRRRRIALAVTAGTVVVLGGMLAIAVYSPILALREVRVEGTSRVDPALVESAVSDQVGTPLALLDSESITAKLGAIPLIRDYTTETVPPDTLIITVTERQPVAVVEAPAGWDLVDPAGIVIQNLPDRPEGMPILSAGERGGTAFTAAVEVLLALPADLRARVHSIEATTEDDVAFRLGDTDQNVYWGSSERSALKLVALQGLMKANKKHPDVDFNVSSPDIALVIQK